MSRLDFDRNLAVVVGINNYQYGIAPLRTAVADARAIAQLLEQKHDYQVLTLLNEEARLAGLKVLLQEILPEGLSANSRLLFYFAGHGIAKDGDDGPAGFLLPQDATPEDADSYLSMVSLHDQLTSLPCRHFLAIFDCCFAGAFRWSSTRKATPMHKVIYRERYDRFRQDPAWQVITSASYDQPAMDVLALRDERGEVIDNQQEKHSPFAIALIQSLQGAADVSPPAKDGKPAGDGVTTATELYVYIRDQVEALTDSQRLRQTPEICTLRNHDRGEYIFLTPDHELNLPEAPPLTLENNPYRGLESFDQAHKDLFFGRDKQIDKLVKRLSQPHPMTVVLGASGTGKSSLVKAGLLPRLSEDSAYYILPVIRPGNHPLVALLRACKDLVSAAARKRLFEQFLSDDKVLSQLVGRWQKQHPDTKLLLVIDQAEELITQAIAPAESAQFQRLIKQAMIEHWQCFRVIATLRFDFEAQFQDEEWRDGWMKSRFMILPMSQSQLRETIEKPAAARVLYFEPPSLVEKLIEDVVQTPGALPLLSFTLSELYLKYLERKSDNRALTEVDYRALGGVAGALTKRATHEYEALVDTDAAYTNTAKHVMLRMISTGGEALARRRVPLSELCYQNQSENERVEQLLKNFIEARLIVRGQDADTEAYVEPAHDALVRGWDKLLRWKNQNQEVLSLQRLVASAVKAWEASHHNIKDLWTDNSRLPRLKEIVNSDDNWLNSREEYFTKRSLQRRKRRRWRDIGIVSAAMASLIVTTIRAVDNARRADTNRREADGNAQLAEQRREISVSRQLAAQSGIFFRQQGNFLPRSVLLAIQAAKQFPQDVQASIADIDQALRSYMLLAQQQHRFNHDSIVREANFSPDGKWIATASEDGTVRVWNAQTYDEQFQITHSDTVQDVQFSADSSFVATASKDNTTEIWNIENRQRIVPPIVHNSDVLRVRFSPDNQHLATASNDNRVRIWDVRTGDFISELSRDGGRAHNGGIIEINWSATGDKLITASRDNTAKIWEWQTRELLQVLPHSDTVWDARFNPTNETQVATASRDGSVIVWDWDGQSPLRRNRFPHGDDVWDVRFAPDGKRLATASSDRHGRIWDIGANRLVSQFSHEEEVWDIRWSSDGSRVVTASADGTARLWEASTGTELLRMTHDDLVYDARFGKDNRQILTGSADGTARVWSASGYQGVTRYRIDPSIERRALNNVRFSPDDSLLAFSGTSHIIHLWDLEEDKIAAQLSHGSKDNSSIVEIQFSPDGQYLVSASADGTARLWDVETGAEIFPMTHGENGDKPEDNKVNNVSFSEDSLQVITASADGTARIWDIQTQQEIRSVAHDEVVQDARLSPDGTLLATASHDKTVKLWDVESGNEIEVLPHEAEVWEIRFSPDGRRLAAVIKGESAVLWNVDTYTEITTLEHNDRIWDVRFSPDGQFMATASSDSTAKLWNGQTGQLLQTLNHDAPVLEVTFSDNSQRVATVSNDKIAQVWELQPPPRQIARIATDEEMRDARFSRDGERLATVSTEGLMRIHDLSRVRMMAEGCKRLTRNLTGNEWERFIGDDVPYERTCLNIPERTNTPSERESE